MMTINSIDYTSSRGSTCFRPDGLVEQCITSLFSELQAGQLLFFHGVLGVTHCFKKRQLLPVSPVAKDILQLLRPYRMHLRILGSHGQSCFLILRVPH